MRIVAELPDGRQEVLTKEDFAWSELDFAIGLAMRLWSPKGQKANDHADSQYWNLFADFIIKYKWLELPFWHVHSMLNFFESGSFLTKLPGQAVSEGQIRTLFPKLLRGRYGARSPVFSFIEELCTVAGETRRFRNMLVHKPWATQGTKIGICGMRHGELAFTEITKEDLFRHYANTLEIQMVLVQLLLGLKMGFVKKHSNACFEGLLMYPPLSQLKDAGPSQNVTIVAE